MMKNTIITFFTLKRKNFIFNHSRDEGYTEETYVRKKQEENCIKTQIINALYERKNKLQTQY
jgi:hypothetical protein